MMFLMQLIKYAKQNGYCLKELENAIVLLDTQVKCEEFVRESTEQDNLAAIVSHAKSLHRVIQNGNYKSAFRIADMM